MKPRFKGLSDFEHGRRPRLGVVLVNLGTPESPTPAALRRYLAEFLSDPRVVEIPRLLWKSILHGIILRVRPKKSALAYASVWTEEGSPLMAISQALTHRLKTVVCPGFASDCLETLEEIAQQGRDSFLQAGGELFDYVPALNADAAHVDLQAARILQHASGWPETSADYDSQCVDDALAATRAYAQAAGAES